MKRRVLYIIPICVLLGLSPFAWHKYRYPYGHRTCQLPCVSMALQAYAMDHSGWFPCGGDSALHSLQMLFGNGLNSPRRFAGVTGSIDQVTNRLDSGGRIDETVSSWVYVPGFRNDDPLDLPILWERMSGFAFNGQRVGKGSHAVALVGGSVFQASAGEWQQLMGRLKEFRQTVLVNRECESGPVDNGVGQQAAAGHAERHRDPEP